ncbi:hypothetical protein Tc00.1047053507169.10 [Trypanosoma cruzi]|uniref:Uncharacterized protein n=1 Tax=Trypanosoma cruzi (strain CL Brener) TaxID=353153 RepID=Q4CMA0_TRYCC|nr:hypothetical protein Tc00.1047053507169.10 [Trypanosoma cruzi]EAN81402.1 hypothetical protein Tc00.1047053507169.10 [Trypanosoma cruzi]|eukprot:XP_802848.1 hypothetical protein [Trypanosoma cruzi strain CL Brener]
MNFYELPLPRMQCNIMSLGSLFPYFCHAPLLYIFVCASLHLLCSCFYFSASCVCRHTQPHARTRCTLQWIWMLLLWRVLVIAGGCCFLRGHEGEEGRGSVHGESLFLRV